MKHLQQIAKEIKDIGEHRYVAERVAEKVYDSLFDISETTGFAVVSDDFWEIDISYAVGGRKDLGHRVVYFVPEMQWFFEDSDGIYKPTTADKLANLYRALMMKCAGEMPGNVHLLNLFHEFRSDKVSKAVVQRAKSILAADELFFSASSSRQRIHGVELHERIARKFVDELLTAAPGNVLLLADAYVVFLKLAKQNNLEPLKRSDFKAVVIPFVQEKFAVCLRNDLKIDDRSGVRGWKNVRLQAVPD